MMGAQSTEIARICTTTAGISVVAEIAHRSGAFLILAAIQALGVFPFDLRRNRVDFWPPTGRGGCCFRKERAEPFFLPSRRGITRIAFGPSHPRL